MLGKAQILDTLPTKTLRRVSQEILSNGARRREMLLEEFMGATSVSGVDIVDRLTRAERVKLASDHHIAVASLSDEELRVTLAGDYSSIRDLDPRSRSFLSEVERVAKHLDSLNCWVSLIASPPANESDVERVERLYGVRFPPVVRALVLGIASQFSFQWSPADSPLESPCDPDLSRYSARELSMFHGRLDWDIIGTSLLEASLFSAGSAPLIPWANSCGGDLVCANSEGAFIWWSAEHSRYHGYEVAPDAESLFKAWQWYLWIDLDRTTVGAMLTAESGIQTDTALGSSLRKLVGL